MLRRPTAAHSATTAQPVFDLGSKPQVRPVGAEVNHRPRHVGVLAQVAADRVPLREPEHVRDLVRVDQVVGLHEHQKLFYSR